MCYPKHAPSLTFTTWQLTDFNVRAKTDESMIPSHQETSRSLHQEHWRVGPCAVQWPSQTARDHCGINEFCWLHQWHRKKARVVIGCPRKLINGVYWGCNPLTNHLQTSWDIQVFRGSQESELEKHHGQQSGCFWGRHISAKPDSVASEIPSCLSNKDIYKIFAMITIPVEQPVERDDIIFNHARLQSSGESTATWPWSSVIQYKSQMDIDSPVPHLAKRQCQCTLWYLLWKGGELSGMLGFWRILIASHQESSNSGKLLLENILWFSSSAKWRLFRILMPYTCDHPSGQQCLHIGSLETLNKMMKQEEPCCMWFEKIEVARHLQQKLIKLYNLRRTNTNMEWYRYMYIYTHNIQYIDTDLDVGTSQKQTTLNFTQQVSIFPWTQTNHVSHTYPPS